MTEKLRDKYPGMPPSQVMRNHTEREHKRINGEDAPKIELELATYLEFEKHYGKLPSYIVIEKETITASEAAYGLSEVESD